MALRFGSEEVNHIDPQMQALTKKGNLCSPIVDIAEDPPEYLLYIFKIVNVISKLIVILTSHVIAS